MHSGTTNRQIVYRPGVGRGTRTNVMNPAGVDDVNLLSTLGAEARGVAADVAEDGQGQGNDVKEPKLVVFSGGTAFNSVAAGTLRGRVGFQSTQGDLDPH